MRPLRSTIPSRTVKARLKPLIPLPNRKVPVPVFTISQRPVPAASVMAPVMVVGPSPVRVSVRFVVTLAPVSEASTSPPGAFCWSVCVVLAV